MTPKELLIRELRSLASLLESENSPSLPKIVESFSIDIEDGEVFSYNLRWKDDIIAN